MLLRRLPRLPTVSSSAGIGCLLSGRRFAKSSSSAAVTFETVDVFSTVPFGGNQLAVCFGAEGLSDGQLQQIAAEFGYSETTFVLPPADGDKNTARVRIFSPSAEISAFSPPKRHGFCSQHLPPSRVCRLQLPSV